MKVINITDKLNFEENPKIKIKDIELEVCSDAPKMLEVMQELTGTTTVRNINKIYETIFSEKDRNKINELNLKFEDFTKLIECAVDLVINPSGEDKGE